MRFDIYLHHIGDPEVLSAIRALQQEVTIMSAAYDRLIAAVRRDTDETRSAVTLIRGLATLVRDLKKNPTEAQIEALAAEIETNTQLSVDAVNENTPAADDPPVDPNAPPPVV